MNRCLAGIDHVTVAVQDLAGAADVYQRLGFAPTPPGRHSGRATGNRCLMLEQGYVELMGIVDPGGPAFGIDAFLAKREGLYAVVLASQDPEATHAAWHEAGLQPGAPAELERAMAPDVRLRFRNVDLSGEATLGVPMFACHALTPELLRRPEWLTHPNRARAIDAVTVVVEDPGAYATPMGAIFGANCVTDTDDTLAVHTGQGVLLFVTPDDLEVMHPEHEASLVEGRPTLAALTLVTGDLDATAACLEAGGASYRRHGSGLAVPPGEACGVLLEFTAGPRAGARPFA